MFSRGLRLHVVEGASYRSGFLDQELVYGSGPCGRLGRGGLVKTSLRFGRDLRVGGFEEPDPLRHHLGCTTDRLGDAGTLVAERLQGRLQF